MHYISTGACIQQQHEKYNAVLINQTITHNNMRNQLMVNV